MNKVEHLKAAIYMIRNKEIGGSEQTRIEDLCYHQELPEPLGEACKYLALTEYDHDGAIDIYVRWHLRQVYNYAPEINYTEVADACKAVLRNTGWDPDEPGWEGDEDEKKERREWNEIDAMRWTNEVKRILT